MRSLLLSSGGLWIGREGTEGKAWAIRGQAMKCWSQVTCRNITYIRLKYVRITFNIYDDQGAIVDNLTASTSDLDPHATWKFWTNHERNYHATTVMARQIECISLSRVCEDKSSWESFSSL